MSKRNIVRVLGDYFIGNTYYNKKDRVRLKDNREIVDNNTLMAYIQEDVSANEEYSIPYIIVSLQDFKSQPTWKTDKDELIRIAMSQDYGMRVIFVPELDIGFGISKLDFTRFIVSNIYLMILPNIQFALDNYLLKVAKYSANNSKNAVMAIKITDDSYYNDIIGIAVDQFNPDGTVVLAEEILKDYINNLPDCLSDDEYIFISLKEPEYNGLKAMIDIGARFIYYSYSNTNPSTEYIQLANDVWSKIILHPTTNHSIYYDKVYNAKVEKFIEKEKSK